jgi:alcohol dehydrogenase class IV
MNSSPVQNTVWQFATASNIRFGRGSLATLSDEMKRLGGRRWLIVTDKTVAKLESVTALFHELKASDDIVVFDDCKPEPSIEIANAAIESGKNYDCDGVIGIGGGSNMDVAKMVAVVLRHGGEPVDYFGFDCVPGPIYPMIAVPTTAGTGSEVSHSSVLSDLKNQVKVSTLSRWLRPAAAIIDPRLSDSCPPTVTAHSGIDAIVHAVEAFTNCEYSEMVGVDPQARAYEGSYPFTRLLAAEAIRLIAKHLVEAYREPANRTARDGMAMAAMLAGMAFSNSGVAVVHALEYPIGALTHCSHGEGNGLLLPHVMRFNLPSCVDRMAEIGRLVGAAKPNEDSMEAAESAVVWVEKLQQDLNIRRRLSDLGLLRESIPFVAQKTFQIKRLMDINPRKPTESDLVNILEAAF